MSAIDHATFPNIEAIAAALRARRTGRGWIARCPAHQDGTPSLSLTESNGRVLVHCHAGCIQADVIAALRDLGLWPKRERKQIWRVATDPKHLRDLERAKYWRMAAEPLADWLLETIDLIDPARMPLTSLVRVLGHDEDILLAEYRRWQAREPKLTAALTRAGRLHDVRVQRRLALWLRRNSDGPQST